MSPIGFGSSKSQSIIGARSYTYVPAIPTSALYAHWDMSLLSYNVGTTFSSFTNLTGTGGTNIGVTSNTPSLSVNFGSSGNPATKPSVISAPRSTKKAFSIPYSYLPSTANYGAWLKSNSPAFPDTASYWTYIVVWSTTSTNSGFQRPYRYDIPGVFFYDDYHNACWWWRYNLGGEIDVANTGTGQIYFTDGQTFGRGSYNSNIHIDIVSQNGRYTSAWTSTSIGGTAQVANNFDTGSFTTQGNMGTRIFEVRPVTYTGYVLYPDIVFYEAATYNTIFNLTSATSTITALWNKWRIA